MTAATADVSTPKLGTPDLPDPPLLGFPVAASTKIFAGTLVGTNASGFAGPATATFAPVALWGICEKIADNSSGNNGDIQVTVRPGVFYIAQDGSISQANVGANCYAVDDQTVSLSDGGGTRLFAGIIMPPETPATLATTDKVPVYVGLANGYQINPELGGASPAFKARAVVTTLQAYTGSGTGLLTETANGAISAADGVTLAVGDVVFIQGGTTNLVAALDSGPWVVTSLGGASAKWTLQRPDWFAHGSTVQLGAVIDLGGEGTLWGGTSWKSFAAKGSAVVDTNDPTFYVGRVTQSVTLAASTATVSNVGIRSASKTDVQAIFQAAGGTTTSTIGYGVIAAPTAGYIGTASAVIDALASGMGKNGASDASTVLVTIINW